MTQTEVKQKLTDLFSQFLNETDLEKLRLVREQIINIFSSVPFDKSNSVGKEIELKLLKDTTNLYIDNNLDSSIKSLLFGDFHRILIHVSLSLLDE